MKLMYKKELKINNLIMLGHQSGIQNADRNLVGGSAKEQSIKPSKEGLETCPLPYNFFFFLE